MSSAELANKYLKQCPNLPSDQLSSLMFKENPECGLSSDTLRKALYRAAKKTGHKFPKADIDILIEEERCKWEVADGVYYWKAAKGTIKMSVDQIDQLFYEYSEHGKNLTQTQIINKHNLKVWEWNSIKNTLLLYKKSNIFSPHTVDTTPPEQLHQMITEKINKMFSNVGEQVETIYNKELNKAYKKAVLEVEEWEVRKKIILTELADHVPQITKEIGPAIRVEREGNGVLCVFIADVHFGAESRTKSIGDYSPQITEQLFTEIANEVNRHGSKEVHVFFVGDNIESATGLNHIDSWKGLAKGYYGSQLMIKAYKAFVLFLSQINNLTKIYAVPGNHDRMTPKREDDSQGFMAEMLFELIRLAFGGKLEVVYQEKVITVSIDNLHYIMTHGHLKLTNISPAELILMYGDPYKFNVLISGHLHNRIVRKDHRNFRHLVCASIFPGNDYSEDLGVSSLPGVLLVKSINGKPMTIDYPL